MSNPIKTLWKLMRERFGPENVDEDRFGEMWLYSQQEPEVADFTIKAILDEKICNSCRARHGQIMPFELNGNGSPRADLFFLADCENMKNETKCRCVLEKL